jgi:sulfite exporter TauE/SafE/copper chaperone CopZ
MNKTTIPIKGMHCRSCELLIEDELSRIDGIRSVNASEKRASVDIEYDAKRLRTGAVEAGIKRAGYAIGVSAAQPWVSRNPDTYTDVFLSVAALVVLLFLADLYGAGSLFQTGAGKPTSLATVLLIGITAGFSTCMALVGGLVLGISTRYAQAHPNASQKEKFTPHGWFNAGRIISYTVLGGVMGAAGSFFQLSGIWLGILTLGVAIVMLTLGMQLTGLFPRLEGMRLTLPKFIGRMVGIQSGQTRAYRHTDAFTLGASTFFLPCGFTQAMQLYAMASGTAGAGAMIMGVFALGTAPGLLGIGGLTSVVRGAFARRFFRFAGVAVVAMSLFNANNALNLIGVSPFPQTAVSRDASAGAVREGNVQVIRMTQTANGYQPNTFTVTRGVPVKWIVNSVDPNTCAASIVSTKLGIRKNLEPGDNVIEFTPTEAGTIPFTCMMGMYRGTFTVVDGKSGADTGSGNGTAVSARTAAAAPVPVSSPGQGGTCGSSGGGCGCGSAAKPVVERTGPAPAVVSGEQLLNTTYTAAQDISPNTFTAKAGVPVKLVVDVRDDGVGCMGSIMVSGQTSPVYLEKGKKLELTFTPKTPGEYLITCAMGIPRGKITVGQ